MSNRHSSQTDKSDLPGKSGNANSPAPGGYEDPMAELARIVAGEDQSAAPQVDVHEVPMTQDSMNQTQGMDKGSNVHSILAVEPGSSDTASAKAHTSETSMADNSELQDLESQLMAELGEVSLTQTPTETVTPSTQTLEQLAREPAEQPLHDPEPVEETIDEMDFDAALEAQLMESTQLTQNAEAQATQIAETPIAMDTTVPVEPSPTFETPVQIQHEPQQQYLPHAANTNEIQSLQAQPVDEYHQAQPANLVPEDQAQRDQLFAELQSTDQSELEQTIQPVYEPAPELPIEQPIEAAIEQPAELPIEPAFVPAAVEPVFADPVSISEPAQLQPVVPVAEEVFTAQMAAPAEFHDPLYHPSNAPESVPATATPGNANLADDEFLEDEFESVFADEFASELAVETPTVAAIAPQPVHTQPVHPQSVQMVQPVQAQIPVENLSQPDNYQQFSPGEPVSPPHQPEFETSIPEASAPAPIAAQSFDPAFNSDIAPASAANPEANFEFEQPVEPLPEYAAQLDEFDLNQDQSVKPAPTGRRWKLMVAALLVALIAGSGAYYFGVLGNAIGTSGPKLVKAVDGPFKVKPENPGGKNIANQDQPVYDNLNGNASQDSTQEKLVTDMEEPLTVTPRSVASSSAPNLGATPNTPRKTAERLPSDTSRNTSQAPFPIIQPRRVKTVTVKPDGTILGGNGNLAALSSQTPPAAVGLAPVQLNTNSVDGAVSSGKLAIPSMNPRFKKSTSEPTGIELPATAQELLEPVSAPAAAPIAPVQRQASLDVPKTRSLTITPRETAPKISNIKTASIPASTLPNTTSNSGPIKVATTPSNAYVVQVSSQRSPEAAKASYENLKRRFASLFEGQPSEIRQAKVEGKGTFYRVRLPHANKSDAAKFCTKFKAAGGSCFVTR